MTYIMAPSEILSRALERIPLGLWTLPFLSCAGADEAGMILLGTSPLALGVPGRGLIWLNKGQCSQMQ